MKNTIIDFGRLGVSKPFCYKVFGALTTPDHDGLTIALMI